jgi:hypothetical protein
MGGLSFGCVAEKIATGTLVGYIKFKVEIYTSRLN